MTIRRREYPWNLYEQLFMKDKDDVQTQHQIKQLTNTEGIIDLISAGTRMLSPDDQELLIARFVKRQTNREIAKNQQVSAEAIRQQVQRLIKRIQKLPVYSVLASLLNPNLDERLQHSIDLGVVSVFNDAWVHYIDSLGPSYLEYPKIFTLLNLNIKDVPKQLKLAQT